MKQNISKKKDKDRIRINHKRHALSAKQIQKQDKIK